MDYRNGKIAQQIIQLQNNDGTWGNEFHSLAVPNNKHPLTTEQALRRLKILGFTIQDEPIRKAVDCMTSCLRGERKIDNYWEKTHDWDLYTKLMLSTWVKLLPKVFASLETSRYLSAVEILSGYEAAKEKLSFVAEWLDNNKDENGQWDLGTKVKDNLYFPLSDSWRTAEYRKADCTNKVSSILKKLKKYLMKEGVVV